MALTARSVVVGAALISLLTACGGGGQPAESPTPTATKAPSKKAASTSPAPSPTPTLSTGDGEPAPEALSGFRCEKIKSGWAASGAVKNATKKAASFQVTIYIGPADGADHSAVTRRLANIAAGGSTTFTIEKIPVETEGECHVQLLRIDQ